MQGPQVGGARWGLNEVVAAEEVATRFVQVAVPRCWGEKGAKGEGGEGGEGGKISFKGSVCRVKGDGC